MSIMEDVLKIAENEIGYLEKASNSNLYNKTANAGSANYTKYWKEIYPSFQGQPWCACFVTWTLVQKVGKEIATKMLKHYPYVYCPQIANLFKLNSTPKVGDIVIFSKNNVFVHTGWVIGVNGKTFTTIEGNTSGANGIIANGGGVKKKTYNLSNYPGTRFITLDWSLATKINFTETTVNLKGSITASELNIRKQPDVNSETLGKYKKGDIVTIYAKTNNGWYKIKCSSGYGYIKGEYVQIKNSEDNLTQEEFNSLMNNWFAALGEEKPLDWSKSARNFVEQLQIINGDEKGNKKYHSYLNREEMAQILFNLKEKHLI